MIDNSSVVLENNNSYDVIDKIKISARESFVYLINQQDKTDFCIQKEVKEDLETNLIGLDDKQEVELAMRLFLEKHLEDEKR